jgi:hypothetical protein
MKDTRRRNRPECEEVFNEVEELKAGGTTVREALCALTEASRRHALECEECRSAVEDFVITREALAPMKAMLPEAGPWFAARVMAAATAAENETEARREGVWISVRRLAPRLAAFAVLLLVLGGTWAMELRRQELASGQAQVGHAEGLFEGASSAPANDEIVATAGEGARP